MPAEPTSMRADDAPCWYAASERRPWISRCPATCNGPTTHAERRADGAQRFYCEGHAFWRTSEIGKGRLRLLRAGELV